MTIAVCGSAAAADTTTTQPNDDVVADNTAQSDIVQSAVDPTNIYVSTTGSDATGDGSQINPYQTIKTGITSVSSDGTVYLADGTYNLPDDYNLTIDKNITINGTTQTSTIIDAQGNGNIFNISPGVSFTIMNLTLQNGNNGVVSNQGGTLNVDNCTFTNNSGLAAIINAGHNGTATDVYIGTTTYANISNSTFTNNSNGAILNGAGGSVDYKNVFNPHFYPNYVTVNITNCTFTNNNAGSGGAILNSAEGTVRATLTNCLFTNNTATWGGGAISNQAYKSGPSHLDVQYQGYSDIDVSGCTFINNNATNGGAIYNTGNCSIDSSKLIGNKANQGGAIYNIGTCHVYSSKLIGNSANQGGTLYNNSSGFYIETNMIGATISSSQIVGNIASQGSAIYNVPINVVYPYMKLANNWWGSNNDPSNEVYNTTVPNWLVLNISANPSTVNNGSSSQATADFLHDNQGNSITDYLVDGIPVTFSANNGTVNPGTSSTINSVATSTFNMGTNPNATIYATVDSQTVSVPIKVFTADVLLNITPNSTKPVVGQQFTYAITATNNGPDNATGVKVTDKLPNGLTFNSYQASQGTYDSNSGIWSLNTLNSGSTANLVLYVTPTASIAGKSVTNTVNETQNEYPQDASPASVTVNVATNTSDIKLTMSTNNTKPFPLIPFTYTITVKNNGPNTATGVKITDILPSSLYYLVYRSSQGAYNSKTGLWNVGALKNGKSATLTLFVSAKLSAHGKNITNTATKTAEDQYDPNTPDTANATIRVRL